MSTLVVLFLLLSLSSASNARLLMTAKDSNTLLDQFNKEINVASLKASQQPSMKGSMAYEINGIKSAGNHKCSEDQMQNVGTKKTKSSTVQNKTLATKASAAKNHPGFDFDYAGPRTHPPSHN